MKEGLKDRLERQMEKQIDRLMGRDTVRERMVESQTYLHAEMHIDTHTLGTSQTWRPGTGNVWTQRHTHKAAHTGHPNGRRQLKVESENRK